MRRLTAVLLIAVAGLAGCAGEQPEPPKVVLPGAPGDQPQVVASAAPDPGVPVDVEAGYLRMMIAHHEQALEMTALAPQRAQHPKVRALAERIGGAQGPEIGAMQGWLDTHGFGEEHSGHGQSAGHDHATMPGMATPAQLAQLRDSTGADFDRLFLQLMIAHHEGALTMATDVLTRGREEQVHAMATDVLVTQQSEIDTMRGLQGEVA
ncbi:DUF305 domain-containing protein [Saccharopolyspora indica]|uniref:DUF305 domain-containing protein n=1 Tax=Saccharopolyspora indica TaxID=1229659 RepID=UPI0022EB1204|nr:DUF305 domain-containing protein [Saccharopolyspora indica]MDA3646769.1 DUF305 domain-containing protein [Saccharopolyspora indica]